MIKSFVRLVLLHISCLISYMFPYSCVFLLNRFLGRLLYTGWICREFKSFGSNSYIMPFLSELKGANCISIGERCIIRPRVTLTAFDTYNGQLFHPKIVIGDNCSIGEGSHITAINLIKFGNNVRSGKNILITDNSHGKSVRELLNMAPNFRPLYSKGPVIIDDNVWIGEKSSIMPGVHIGKGVIVAANSVVTKNVPPYCVVAGVPAKVVKVME
ncbi:acyltransferase [Parabacteroides sp.]|uniref:acyltransferase n=1 Tax=Parabacteroides sp. TaxID=1869337 RepID=UPI00257B8281|nr:acyltransferase [Parabacteroides sp.]